MAVPLLMRKIMMPSVEVVSCQLVSYHLISHICKGNDGDDVEDTFRDRGEDVDFDNTFRFDYPRQSKNLLVVR